MPNCLIRTIIFLFLMITNSVFAGEAIEEVVVSRTLIRNSDLMDDSILSWQIQSEELALMNPVNTLDILRRASGLVVTQQGGGGGLSFVSIRGGDPNFTKVMVDGVSVDNPTNSRGGGFDFAALEPSMIESIDVFYGAYSSLYGSSGLSGIVNVITKRPGEERELSLQLEVGTDDSHAEAIVASGQLTENLVALLSLSSRKGAEAIEGDSLKRQQLTFKLSTLGREKYSIDFGGFFSVSDATAYPEDSGGDRLAVARIPAKRDMTQSNLHLSGAVQVTPIWQSDFLLSHAAWREENKNPGITTGVFDAVPPISSDTDYSRSEIRWDNSFQIVDDMLHFGLGFSGQFEDADNGSVIDFGFPIAAGFSTERETWSVYTELQFRAGSFNFLAGHRWDHADGINEQTSRFHVGYSPEWTEAHLSYSYSEGFKLPSIFALVHPLVGNSGLQPELAQSHEVSIHVPLQDKISTTLMIYKTRYQDLVDFDPTLFTNINRSEVLIKGGQMDVDWQLGKRLHAGVFVGYIDSDIVGEPEVLRRRPRWQGGTTLDWQIKDNLDIAISYISQSRFHDSSIPTGVVGLEGFNQVDLSALWRVTNKTSIKLVTNNLFDREFEETVGFSNPGRQIRLILSTRL